MHITSSADILSDVQSVERHTMHMQHHAQDAEQVTSLWSHLACLRVLPEMQSFAATQSSVSCLLQDLFGFCSAALHEALDREMRGCVSKQNGEACNTNLNKLQLCVVPRVPGCQKLLYTLHLLCSVEAAMQHSRLMQIASRRLNAL